MSAPVPILGRTTTFTFGSNTALVCKSIHPPAWNSEKQDVSNLTSGAKEFIAGMMEAGAADLVVFYDPANAGIIALIAATGGAAQTSVVTFPNTHTITGSAFVAGIEIDDVTPGEPMTATVHVQYSGVLTFA